MTLNTVEGKEPSKEIFEWIQFRKEIGATDDIVVEGGVQKFKRKFKENPFVPIGATATVGCLTYGLYCFRRGDTRMSQYMMRARVAAQGFTLLALVGGIYFATSKTVPNNK